MSKMTDNPKGLILVDPPVQNTFLEDTLSHDGNQKEAQIGKCQVKPFRKGYTDFLSPTPGMRCSGRKTMAEDLEHYLTTEWPPNLNLVAPDLHTMCWYPLKIAAAEWMNFIDAMEYSVEGCEYNTESRFVTDTASLESSLRSLLSWRRRSRDMAAVVRSTAEFIRLPNPNKSSAWVAMASDYDHIARELDRLGWRFEALCPAVASLIGVAGGRRILQVTYLALAFTLPTLLFLPFMFASSLFSMSGDTAPGGKKFWVYFTVSGPLWLLTLVFVAHRYGWRIRRKASIVG